MAAVDYKVKEFLFGIVVIANLGHVLSRSLPTGNVPCPMPALQYPYPFQGSPALPRGYYNPQIPQVYQPPQPVGTFYDSKRGILRSFPGGGLPVLVDYHKRCSNNFVGIKPHPKQRQYYYVCKPDCVVFGKCQNLQYFDATKHQCTPYPTPNYTPFCTKPGRFPILSDCTIYYRCDENLKPRIHTCPKNTVFAPQKEKCISGAQCYPTEVSPYGSHIPQDCENKFPPCLRDGTFRSPTDCSLFYTCTMQMKGIYLQTRFKCPALTFYDTTRGACWPQHEVACDCIQLSELVYPRPPPLPHLPVVYPRHYSWDSLEDSAYSMDSSKSSSEEDTLSLSVGSSEENDQTTQTSFSRKENFGLPQLTPAPITTEPTIYTMEPSTLGPSTDSKLTTLFNEEWVWQSNDLTSPSPALTTDVPSSTTSDPLTTKLSEEENAAALQDDLVPITTTTTEPTMEPSTHGPSTESPSLFNEELVWQSNDITPASPGLTTDVASSTTADPLTTKFSEEENVAALQDNLVPITTTMDPSTLDPSTDSPTLFNEEFFVQSFDLTNPNAALTPDADSLTTSDPLTTMSTDSTIGSNEGPDHSTLAQFSEEENAAVLQDNLAPVTTTMDPSTLDPSTDSPTLFNEEFFVQSFDLTNPNAALTPDADSLTTSDPLTTMSTDSPIGSYPPTATPAKESPISTMEPSTLSPSTETPLPALSYEELMLESLDVTGSSPAFATDPYSLPTTPKTAVPYRLYTKNSIQNSTQTPPETHNTEINNVIQNEIRYARSNTTTMFVGEPESNDFDVTDIGELQSDEIENIVYSNADDSSWLTTTQNMRKNNSTNENRTQTTKIITNNPIDSNFSNKVKRMASTNNVVPKNLKPATERRNAKAKLNHPRGNRADNATYYDADMEYNEVLPAIQKVWPNVEAVLTTERATYRDFTTSSHATKVEDAKESFGLGIESTLLQLTTDMPTPKWKTEEFRTLPTAASSIKQTRDDKGFEMTLEAEKPRIPILKRSFGEHEENVTTRQIEENAKRSMKWSSTEKTLVEESVTTTEKTSEAINANADLIFTAQKAKKDRKGLKELKVAEKPSKISTAKRFSAEKGTAESFESTSGNTETKKNHAHRISAAAQKEKEAKEALEDSQKLSTTGSL